MIRSLVRSNKTALIFIASLPLLSWLSNYVDRYYFMILMLVGIHVILATSLNLVTGITGQFSLGHAGFMAVGAYVSASITYYIGKAWMEPALAGMPPMGATVIRQAFFFVALGVGGLSSALCGWLVGLPSLRLRGDYLAIVTLGFGEIIRVLILNMDAIGGARGFPDIPQYTNFAWLFTIVAFTIFVMVRLVHSAYGRALLAVREDEIAAESVGVSTTRFKVMAFVISAFFAGLAGGLFAHFYSYINPSTFSFLKSFEIVTMVVLGGMGSFSGSIVAAFVLTILPEALRPLQEFTKTDFRMVIYSFLLIVMMLTRPNGLFGKHEIGYLLRLAWRKLFSRRLAAGRT